MTTIIKIVMLCYLCLNIDVTQAIGCNLKSSECIRETKDNSIVQKFQKMLCPIQKRFSHCWDVCTKKEKILHYEMFLKLRISIHLCDEKIETSTDESLEIAKCVTETFYQEFLKCSDNTDARHRSPSKNIAPNQGFINVLIFKYCVDSSVVEENSGSDAYIIIDRMKRVILPTMNEYDMAFM